MNDYINVYPQQHKWIVLKLIVVIFLLVYQVLILIHFHFYSNHHHNFDRVREFKYTENKRFLLESSIWRDNARSNRVQGDCKVGSISIKCEAHKYRNNNSSNKIGYLVSKTTIWFISNKMSATRQVAQEQQGRRRQRS